MEKEKVEIKEEISISYPCYSCGAELHYNPIDENMKCEFCGYTEEIEVGNDTDIMEYNIENVEEENNVDWEQKMRVLHCKNCGAENNIDNNAKAICCPFCGSSQVVKEEEKSKRIKPESLIPFVLGKKEIEELFLNWLKKRWFAPNSLKNEAKSNKLQGVYIPYWTYDSNTYTDYVAKRGVYYYEHKTETNSKGETITKEIRKTRWTRVDGNLTKYYNEVLVSGSKNYQNNLLAKVAVYDLSKLVKYNPKFLSGFMAERYSINVQEGWELSEKIINDKILEDIRVKVDGDEFKLIKKNTVFIDILYKHFLVPVWMSNYKFRGKNYQYVINGQTGEVEGEYPKSFVKIFILILLCIIVFYIIYYFVEKN